MTTRYMARKAVFFTVLAAHRKHTVAIMAEEGQEEDDIDAFLADDVDEIHDAEPSAPTFRVAAEGSASAPTLEDSGPNETDTLSKNDALEYNKDLDESWADMMDEDNPIETVIATEAPDDASM